MSGGGALGRVGAYVAQKGWKLKALRVFWNFTSLSTPWTQMLIIRPKAAITKSTYTACSFNSEDRLREKKLGSATVSGQSSEVRH